MTNESKKITRRDILAGSATMGVLGLVAGRALTHAEEAPGVAGNRQADALSIRKRAAVHGIPRKANFTPKSEPDDVLRVTEYAKALDRTTIKEDPYLPSIAAFHSMRLGLDSAYGTTPQETANQEMEAVGDVIGSALPAEKKALKLRLTNPLGGLSFDLEGYDPPLAHIRQGPAFESSETAAEAVEAYWMALLRETELSALDSVPKEDIQNASGHGKLSLQDAINELRGLPFFVENPELIQSFWRARIPASWFAADKRCNTNDSKKCQSDASLASFPGVAEGGYVSQFLLRGTTLPENKNSSPKDGIVAFGPQRLSQQIVVGEPQDYLFDPADWKRVHGGDSSEIGNTKLQKSRKFITTIRDGASYVHFDEIYQEYLIAASILVSMVPQRGATFTTAAVEQRKPARDPQKCATFAEGESAGYIAETGQRASYLNCGNPYRYSESQNGFATFGITHILTLLAETSTRAHKAGWYHKWKQRRLRPEEYSARIQATCDKAGTYQIPDYVLNSAAARATYDKYKSYLLPQAFSEGCPTHPAYPSGHATVAGASVTVLKAMFNETMRIPDYRVKDGSLEIESGFGLSVGGELNKLASNILFFRGFAGVHWRSDSIEGALMGERVAIELLFEQTIPSENGTRFYREMIPAHDGRPAQPPYFRFTTFKGRVIDIVDGKIFYVNAIKETDQNCWTRTEMAYDYESFVRDQYPEAFT